MSNRRLLFWIGTTLSVTLLVCGYALLADLPLDEVLYLAMWINAVSGLLALILWLGKRQTSIEDAKYDALNAESDWESGFSTRTGRPLNDTYRSRKIDEERRKFLEKMQNDRKD